jgi:hypothetical protein
LTDQILRPANPANPAFRSAADILRGIDQLKTSRVEGPEVSETPMETADMVVSKTLPRP